MPDRGTSKSFHSLLTSTIFLLFWVTREPGVTQKQSYLWCLMIPSPYIHKYKSAFGRFCIDFLHVSPTSCIPPRVCYTIPMQTDTQKLIHHISRLEGQLQSIKRELSSPEPDCEKAALTLKAASRSFSTLRMAFVSCFLKHKYLSKKTEPDSIYQSLIQVINS
jgi:DNA-binding FrmR family transcriptional regulator